MSQFIFLAAFAISPGITETYTSASAATAFLKAEVQTGTLIINKGDCLAIKAFSNSSYTHAAVVAVEQGTPFVYDSQHGHGVRRQTLEEYLDSEGDDALYLLHPRRPFSKSRKAAFIAYLREQLGRPYAVAHYVTGKRAAGVHCSEYVTDALIKCRLIRADRPQRVSPGSLAEGVLRSGLYNAAKLVMISAPVTKPVARNKCEKLWLGTKSCVQTCWRKLSRWFCCK